MSSASACYIYTFMSAIGFGVAALCFAMQHEYAVVKPLVDLVAQWLAMGVRFLVDLAQDTSFHHDISLIGFGSCPLPPPFIV